MTRRRYDAQIMQWTSLRDQYGALRAVMEHFAHLASRDPEIRAVLEHAAMDIDSIMTCKQLQRIGEFT